MDSLAHACVVGREGGRGGECDTLKPILDDLKDEFEEMRLESRTTQQRQRQSKGVENRTARDELLLIQVQRHDLT